MRLRVADKDMTGDLGREIVDAARDMAASKSKDELPIFLRPEDSVLSLRSARNEAEYLDRLTTLMLSRTGIGTLDFHIPRKPGLVGSAGAAMKRILWKLFRYQHDRVAFQQNSINIQLTAAIEFMQAEYEQRIRALENRISDLEKKGN